MLAYYKLLGVIDYVTWDAMIDYTCPGRFYINRALLFSEHSYIPEIKFAVPAIDPLSL